MDHGRSDEECRPFGQLGALVSEWMFLARVPPLATSHLFERPGMCSSTTSMEGKTVIVTGATSGIGLETAMELARRKARVILACRDVEKASAVAQLIRAETKQTAVVKKLVLDSFESVREFCDQVNRSEDRLDVLVNNAGLINCSTEFTYTKDGFEACFQANHLSPVLLTLMLLVHRATCGTTRAICQFCSPREAAEERAEPDRQRVLGLALHRRRVAAGSEGAREVHAAHALRGVRQQQAGHVPLHRRAGRQDQEHRRHCKLPPSRPGADSHSKPWIIFAQTDFSSCCVHQRKDGRARRTDNHTAGGGPGAREDHGRIFRRMRARRRALP
ncbi:retinol dehydrogenase 12 isoform X3 [Dermacentor silvarum]|uniref:retinol dehydrogenase 12 isoform X3 n=1 Tax=Dermacentor silvarum TaxID=543639 RepID=UPI001898768D|nr:retinol dehydrogenase 12 isoform X3 [Dermacentor silvarum]